MHLRAFIKSSPAFPVTLATMLRLLIVFGIVVCILAMLVFALVAVVFFVILRGPREPR